MHLVQFHLGGEIVPGVISGKHLVNLKAASLAYSGKLRSPVESTLALLRHGEGALEEVRKLVASLSRDAAQRPQGIPAGVLVERSGARLAAPILGPQKIIGVGLNYRDHCEENNLTPPPSPVTFSKYPSAIIGPDEEIMPHPEATQQVDYEAELAVVMGKEARSVSESKALEYVAGYTIVNDISARDIQFSEKQWVRAKSLDTFCPIGPAIVTKDEIPDPQSLDIRCLVNGTEVQHSNTRQLLFGVAALIAFLSGSITLLPGDIISTGTPGGVGYYREPQLFLKSGDTVQAEVERIGTLRNPVR